MINLFKVFMSPTAPAKVGEVLMSGFIGQGKKVDEFEAILSQHFGTKYVNTVNSCTSGLELIVEIIKRQWRWEPGDEIITTPLTCTATNFAILSRGAKLKWADVDPNNYNIDLDDVARKLSPTTKAIMVVHWGGYAVDLNKLEKIRDKCCDLYGFRPKIIEDCAHAWGARYNGKIVGATHENFAAFSFQAIKHLTTGDGGVVISPDSIYHEQAKLLRWYGLDRTSNQDFRCAQNIREFGFKFHMNDIAATIGIENFPHVNELVQQNMENGKFYNKRLANVSGVTLPENESDRESSYWIYTIAVENRDGFVAKMKEKGIMVSQVHDRNDKHKCVKDYKVNLPGLDKLSSQMIAIPCGWWVGEEDRQYIVDTIKKGW